MRIWFRCLAVVWIAWVSSTAVHALDLVDPGFAPIIRGPGTVQAMAWHPGSNRLYVSVAGDKLNGQLLTTHLVRFDAAGSWDQLYAPAIDGTVSRLLVLANGNILLAGSFTSVDGHATNRLARLLSDGTVDTTFTVPATNLPSNFTALAAAPDGTIYLGTSGYPQTNWTATGFVTVWPKLLYKVNAGGVVDASFAPGFGLVDTSGTSYYYFGNSLAVNALYVTSTGDVVAGGSFTQVNGTATNYLAKLSSTGGLDSAYKPQLGYTQNQGTYFGFGASAGVSALTDAGDGKVYVGGLFNSVNGYAQSALARFNADGSLDPAFRVNFSSPYFYPGSQPSVSRIAVDSTGRLVIVGSFDGIDNVAKSGVARLDAYGRMDLGFSTNFGYQDYMVLQANDSVAFGRNGSLAVNGEVQPAIGRVTASGVTDSTFRPDLRNRRYPDWMTARPNQGPIVGSIWIKEVNGQDVSGGIAALGLNGAVDTAFATHLAVNGTVNTSLVLPDGRILLGGSFTSVGGLSRPRLALVEADGTPVAAFDLGTGPDSEVRLLKLLPSGKILVGGYFNNLSEEICQNVALLDLSALTVTQGLVVEEILEAHYGTDLFYADVRTQVTQACVAGGIVLVVNNSTMGGDPASGSSKYLTVRYRSNLGERTTQVREGSTLRLPNLPWDSGLIDRRFKPTHTEWLGLTDAAEQADGKILLLGSFSTFSGQGIPRLVRLQPTGALDSTFLPQAQFSSFYPDLLRLDMTGRIYLGGSSMTLTGSSSSRSIYRLLPDGTLDASFNCPAFLSSVEDLTVTPDGSIWCGGSFYSSTAGERKRLARLLPSGEMDTRFDAGESANSTVNLMSLEAPSRLWISGSFSTVQGTTRDGVALLNLSTGVAPLAQVVPTEITTAEGTAVRFYLANLGVGEAYTWLRNGLVVPGADGASLTISRAEPIHAGTYTAQVINNAGQTNSSSVLKVQEANLATWLALNGIPPSDGAVDSDGDGLSNQAEYIARTNPNDSRSVFTSQVEAQTGSVRLRWNTYPGRQYFIEESGDLVTWDTLAGPIAGNGAEQVVDVPFSPSDHRLFWRVRVSQ